MLNLLYVSDLQLGCDRSDLAPQERARGRGDRWSFGRARYQARCDLSVFHEFGIPATLWVPRGRNAHMPDEYVEIESLVQSTKALLAFVFAWCGEEGR